jgi:predicted SAM-dependent methyltransferase
MAKSNLKIVEVEPEKPKKPGLRLDLGCGDNKKEGFKGVDFVKTKSTDYVHDLLKFPWPFKESSVEEVHCSHFFEHIPAKLRPRFMDELFRVLEPGAKVTIITPYFNSVRATQDFTHEWPPVSPNSFLYFNRNWRNENKLTHGYYEMKCDFDFTYGYSIAPAWGSKSEEARAFAVTHYNEVISDLHTTLVSRKGK